MGTPSRSRGDRRREARQGVLTESGCLPCGGRPRAHEDILAWRQEAGKGARCAGGGPGGHPHLRDGRDHNAPRWLVHLLVTAVQALPGGVRLGAEEEEGPVHRHMRRDTPLRAPRTGRPLPVGAAWAGAVPGSGSGFSSQPLSPGTREAPCFLATPGSKPGQGPLVPAPTPFLILVFLILEKSQNTRAGRDLQTHLVQPPLFIDVQPGAQGGK